MMFNQRSKRSNEKPITQNGTKRLPGDDISDEALIRAIAVGVTWAMEQLYDRYSRLLYSLVYRMVKDHQIAEDLLQESFLAVWRRANSYSAQSGSVRGWLIAIVHHRTIDYLRSVNWRDKGEQVSLLEVDYDDALAFPDAWDETWRGVQGAQVRKALQQLSNEQRQVIELAYFQGLTHKEIAEHVPLPLGTVKARMRLGLLRLKHLLAQVGLTEL